MLTKVYVFYYLTFSNKDLINYDVFFIDFGSSSLGLVKGLVQDQIVWLNICLGVKRWIFLAPGEEQKVTFHWLISF